MAFSTKKILKETDKEKKEVLTPSASKSKKLAEVKKLCKAIDLHFKDLPLDPAFISYIKESPKEFNLRAFGSSLKLFQIKYKNKDSVVENIKNSSYAIEIHFYPFANENGFGLTLDQLEKYPIVKTEKINMILLTGESNFLSLSPEIDADIVLCNDIDPRTHQHMRHLLNCIKKAKNRKEFNDKYVVNNPSVGVGYYFKEGGYMTTTLHNLRSQLKASCDILKHKSFLSSEERFQECKAACLKLHFVFSKLNLFDIEQCTAFSKLLQKHHASLQVVNVSNLHMYDVNQQLGEVLKILLKESSDPNILYSLPNGYGYIYGAITSYKSYLAKTLEEYQMFLQRIYENSTEVWDKQNELSAKNQFEVYYRRSYLPQLKEEKSREKEVSKKAPTALLKPGEEELEIIDKSKVSLKKSSC